MITNDKNVAEAQQFRDSHPDTIVVEIRHQLLLTPWLTSLIVDNEHCHLEIKKYDFISEEFTMTVYFTAIRY